LCHLGFLWLIPVRAVSRDRFCISNLLCLGGRITGYLEALDILEAWLTTPYEGGRHDISLGLIAEAEQALCNPRGWSPAEPTK
jgi:ribose 5-phosphate isomerase B